MYSRILSLIGVMLLIQGCTRPSGRAQVDKDFVEMKSEIAAQTLDQSWKTIEGFEGKMKELRDSKPRQGEEDEIYLDRLAFGLKEIPRGKKLTEEECGKIESKLILDFDPTSTPETRHPALSKTLDVLEVLCTK